MREGELSIVFDTKWQLDPSRDSYVAMAVFRGKRIRCFIPRTTISDCFDNPHPTTAQSYKILQKNRSTIEAAMQRIIAAGFLDDYMNYGTPELEAVLSPDRFVAFSRP